MKTFLPEYPVPEEHTTDSFFRHISEQGLEQRLEFLQQQLPAGKTLEREMYWERLKVELDVIIQMGFSRILSDCNGLYRMG